MTEKSLYKNVIAVTDRRICEGSFCDRVAEIADLGVRGIILREKDLPPDEYRSLALRVMKICEERSALCILHTHAEIARELSCPRLHLSAAQLHLSENGSHIAECAHPSPPPPDLNTAKSEAGLLHVHGAAKPAVAHPHIYSMAELSYFTVLGASVHSKDEAVRAEKYGCTYLIAGHIRSTGCKPGLPARGLDFLSEICRAVDIPVYAIGGMRPEDLPSASAAGAAGICMMSPLMRPPLKSSPGRLP